jgi:hypothetical protein
VFTEHRHLCSISPFWKFLLINNYQKERNRTHNLEVASPPRYHTAMESVEIWCFPTLHSVTLFTHLVWKKVSGEVGSRTHNLDDANSPRYHTAIVSVVWWWFPTLHTVTLFTHIVWKKVLGERRSRTHDPADARPPRYHTAMVSYESWWLPTVHTINRSCYGLSKQKSREGVIDWYTNKNKIKKFKSEHRD